MKKQEKGITLIALVITIIVMLILVAVTISIAINGGLFDYARTAQEETIAARDQEQGYANVESGQTYNELMEQYVMKYPIYSVGDVVTIADQDFYVIEDSNTFKSTVKLLAAQNVETDPNNEKYNQQSSSAGIVLFDSTEPYTNIYGDSTIKNLVNTYVESLGVTVQEGRLMTLDEIVALGATVDPRNIDACPAFIKTTKYWLQTPKEGTNDIVYHIDRNLVVSMSYDNRGEPGLRPVIVILKTNIPEQN